MPKPFTLFSCLFSIRTGGVLLFLIVSLCLNFFVRLALLGQSFANVTCDGPLLATFGWGLLFDLGTISLFAVPLILLVTAVPNTWFNRRWFRALMHLSGFAILLVFLFVAMAEWVFWDEFEVRFNFIAVDYLIYTTEVLGNIRESYPLPQLISLLVLVTAGLHFIILKSGIPKRWLDGAAIPQPGRLRQAAAWLCIPLLAGVLLSEQALPEFKNNYNKELAKNGIWSFVAAFRNNELDYHRFYPSIASDKAFTRLHQELAQDGSQIVDPAARDTLRQVTSTGEELRPNIIQITVESLSATFLGLYNQSSTLTPNLDALAANSLVFDNFYATGTRTDRGMEALALSLPPTPGRSLIKRPRNENLFSLGSVLRVKGYDTAFIYGGYGYFDNMNYFFGNNGYRVIDRNSVSKDEVTFANAWGACDEDLFRWTLREADASHGAGKPFHFFVMTTSNHRPYTFPDGRIDLPSKTSGRSGAVKYTDFAIGQLLREASTRPWYKNTLFVIVADHCASSAGRSELPVKSYHIPLFIFAPGGQIAPGRITTLASQMDFAPTLLGLLNWSYQSRFFGHDVRKIDDKEAHALIGNYQKVGYLEQDVFTILKPVAKESAYSYDFATGALEPVPIKPQSLEETISYYQVASEMYRDGTYLEMATKK